MGKKERTQKQTYASMPEWFLIKMQKEFNGRKIVSQQMVQKQLDINGHKINKPKSHTCSQISSKWIIDLNVKYKKLKLLGKK